MQLTTVVEKETIIDKAKAIAWVWTTEAIASNVNQSRDLHMNSLAQIDRHQQIEEILSSSQLDDKRKILIIDEVDGEWEMYSGGKFDGITGEEPKLPENQQYWLKKQKALIK